MGPDGQYLPPPPEMMPQSVSPEPLMSPEEQYLMATQPPRSMAQFQQHPGEAWWRHDADDMISSAYS